MIQRHIREIDVLRASLLVLDVENRQLEILLRDQRDVVTGIGNLVSVVVGRRSTRTLDNLANVLAIVDVQESEFIQAVEPLLIRERRSSSLRETHSLKDLAHCSKVHGQSSKSKVEAKAG